MTDPLKVGDLVDFTGAGVSVLDGGPGRVVKVEGGRVWVQVRDPCIVAHNRIEAGERYVFRAESLALAVDYAQDEGRAKLPPPCDVDDPQEGSR